MRRLISRAGMAGLLVGVLGLVGCGETADYPSNPELAAAFKKLDAATANESGSEEAEVEPVDVEAPVKKRRALFSRPGGRKASPSPSPAEEKEPVVEAPEVAEEKPARGGSRGDLEKALARLDAAKKGPGESEGTDDVAEEEPVKKKGWWLSAPKDRSKRERKPEPEVVEEKKPKKVGFWARLFGGGKAKEEVVEDEGGVGEPVELVKIDTDAALSTQFKQACRAAADDASGGSVQGNSGWYFAEDELEALASGNASLTAVAAVAEYSRQLRKRGIQLVVLPVPPKAVVYPDEVYPGWDLSSRKVERFDGGLMTLYAELRSRGVEVVDVTAGMIERRNAKTGRMYPKTDGDWSARACELAAAAVADRVAAVGWATGELRVAGITASETTLDLRGDLAGTGTAAETVAVRAVRQNGARMESLSSAPMLVIGDGNALTYRDGGGGIADQLAAEMRVAFEVVAADGPGRNVPRSRVLRKTVASPDYWERKKCVVWVLNGSEFLRGDWQQVPVSLAFQEGEEELRSEE